MPSSDYNMISKVLDVVVKIRPESILDVGCGNGRYGFLFRECLDWNHHRLLAHTWSTKIDCVEIDPGYITPVHDYVYNDVYLNDWLDPFVEFKKYDLIFMGDVLEHFTDNDWPKALKKANRLGSIVLVACPNWEGSIAQEAWYGHEHEAHRTVLSPQIIGGRCLYATSKMFLCGFDNIHWGILNGKDICNGA